LDSINKDLRSQMEKRLDMEKFQAVTGCTMDDIFNSNKVKDVWISAKDAKKIGLVNEIIRLDKAEMKAFNSKFVAYIKPERGSEGGSQGSGANASDTKNNNIQNPVKMTKQELKAQHPELYSAILAEGHTEERERVQAWLAFIDYDKDNVIACVKDGKMVTQSVMAEMTVKITASAKVTALGKDGKTIPPITTGEATDFTAEEEELKNFSAQVKKNNEGLKSKVF
jgi:hypothetical protein